MRLGLLLIAFGLCGCARLQYPLNQDRVDAQFVVPRDGARTSDIRIEARSKLAIRGGACSLLQARARYDANRAKVTAEHVQDERGNSVVDLKLGTEEAVLFHTSLDVCLSTELPITLSTKAIASDSELDLSGIQLRRLGMVSKSGDIVVDLSDAMVANAPFTVETETGDVEINTMRASWTGESTMQISAGSGDVMLQVPSEIGLELSVESETGEVVVQGLEVDDDPQVHRNALSSTASEQLRITIESGSGDVTVVAG